MSSRRIFVVAATYAQASAWAREQGVSYTDWAYVDRPDVIRGCENPDMRYLPGWTRHPHASEIQDVAMAMTRGRDTTPRAGRYRSKPVEIEACRASFALEGFRRDWKSLPQWLQDAYESGRVIVGHDHLLVRCRNGHDRASGRDWVIKGSLGNIDVVEDSVFQDRYEVV